METIRNFLSEHKDILTNTLCGFVAGMLAAIIILFSILFGYYQISPQDAVHVTITDAIIEGTKEDGSQINGFIITTEDGTEYLVTDYWSPIVLSDDIPEE